LKKEKHKPESAVLFFFQTTSSFFYPGPEDGVQGRFRFRRFASAEQALKRALG
jgi:hypothetical protein